MGKYPACSKERRKGNRERRLSKKTTSGNSDFRNQINHFNNENETKQKLIFLTFPQFRFSSGMDISYQ